MSHSILSCHGDEKKQSQTGRGNQDSDESKCHVNDTCKHKNTIYKCYLKVTWLFVLLKKYIWGGGGEEVR